MQCCLRVYGMPVLTPIRMSAAVEVAATGANIAPAFAVITPEGVNIQPQGLNIQPVSGPPISPCHALLQPSQALCAACLSSAAGAHCPCAVASLHVICIPIVITWLFEKGASRECVCLSVPQLPQLRRMLTVDVSPLAQVLVTIFPVGVNVQPQGLNIAPALIAVTPGRVSINPQGGTIGPALISVSAAAP